MTQQQISPITAETLSALMDGEAGDFELRRLLQQLPGDPALRGTWSRYQLVSAVLQKQACNPVVSLSLAESVQAAIIREDVNAAPVTARWHKHTARFAVAASVALAVVAGVQWQQRDMVTGVVVAAAPAPVMVQPVLRVDSPMRNALDTMPVSQPLSMIAPVIAVDGKSGVNIDGKSGQARRLVQQSTAQQGMVPLMPVTRKNER